jgi:hypothetical protein
MCSRTVYKLWGSLSSRLYSRHGVTVVVVESLCVVASGSEVQVKRFISFGCVVELFTGWGVCPVVLTGPVDPTLCCPANGIRLGLRFLDGGTHFCTNIYTFFTNIYTDDQCLSHTVSLLVTLACVCYLVFDRGAVYFEGGQRVRTGSLQNIQLLCQKPDSIHKQV